MTTKPAVLEKITVREIWPLLTVIGSIIVTAASTFFLTRAALEARLSTVEAKLHTTERLRTYTDAALVHHQINSLRVLEDEFGRLDSFFSSWSVPQLVYGRRIPGSPPNFPDSPFDIVIDRSDAPLHTNMSTDISSFYRIVANQYFTALTNGDFVARTVRVYDALMEFNIAVKEDITATGGAFRLSPASPFQGMPKTEAEKRLETARQKAHDIREMLRGMSKAAEEERRSVEKNLPVTTT